jgi:hypothetical protein
MYSPRILATVVAVGLVCATSAQDVITRTKKDGNARTTTVIPVEAPKVTNPSPAGAPGEAKGVVVNVTKWICGQQFTDDKGQTFCLAYGAHESTKPDKLAGWMIRAKTGKLLFVSADGSVFVPCPAGTPPPKAALGADILKALEQAAKDAGKEKE